jgi:hypothetical protein
MFTYFCHGYTDFPRIKSIGALHELKMTRRDGSLVYVMDGIFSDNPASTLQNSKVVLLGPVIQKPVSLPWVNTNQLSSSIKLCMFLQKFFLIP